MNFELRDIYINFNQKNYNYIKMYLRKFLLIINFLWYQKKLDVLRFENEKRLSYNKFSSVGNQ